MKLADALAQPGFGAIAEFKRRSPSAGDFTGGKDQQFVDFTRREVHATLCPSTPPKVKTRDCDIFVAPASK